VYAFSDKYTDIASLGTIFILDCLLSAKEKNEMKRK
jgi:hypothetical protein